ncbi:MAG: diaminopropionate ammonia-lyase [Alphaproteobacteria bacterium]
MTDGPPPAILLNPRADAGAPFGPAQRAIMDADEVDAARRAIASWPGYAPTPLIALPGLAAELGLGALWVKDEGRRLGLGSFKALGGAYAVYRLVAEAVHQATGRRPSSAELIASVARDVASAITVTTATDGNHGRSVAWGAHLFGCRAVIYMHEGVSAGRVEVIEGFGADVVRVAGNYDDSVRVCAADAARLGRHVVSDTAYEGYTTIPCTVMHGYAVMVDEIVAQLPAGDRPSHLVVQGGCGGFAAAVHGRFWQLWGRDRPRLIVVEPDNAACLHASAMAGRLTVVGGALDTVMGGLACGEVSLVAWPILDRGTAAFVTLADPWAVAAMRRLASGAAGDPPVAAGVAALLAIAAGGAAATVPGLGHGARVLAIVSEGATDPAVYRALVGRGAEAVGVA